MITSILMTGELGAGKSLSAVMLAVLLSSGSSVPEQEVPIFSNITLFHENYKPIRSESDWHNIVDYRKSGSILLLDETQSLLDSRQSMSKGNIQLTRFLAYLRKMRCLLIMTCPDYSMVDKRVRDMLSKHVHVTKHSGSTYWTIENPRDDSYVKTKRFTDGLEAIYPYYDTYELVAPIEIPNKLEDFIQEAC